MLLRLERFLILLFPILNHYQFLFDGIMYCQLSEKCLSIERWGIGRLRYKVSISNPFYTYAIGYVIVQLMNLNYETLTITNKYADTVQAYQTLDIKALYLP